jgi:hypothetical protein
MTPTKQLLGITALVTVFAIPGFANAQTCADNSECAQGLTCQAISTTPPPTPACPPGADCLPIILPPAPSQTCLPAPCQTAAECGQEMVCHSETTTVCSGGTGPAVKCLPNAPCPTPPPPTDPVCTETTTSQCTYRWQLPCNADADCGTGFVCQPTTMGMCSGSGPVSGGSGSSSSSSGTGGGSGGLPSPPPLPAPDAGISTPVCVTTTSFPGFCQPKAASCNLDSDCPSILKCVDWNPTTTVSSGPMATDAGAAPTPIPPAATGTAVATATATATATSTATRICQPPNSYVRSSGGDGNSQPTIDIGRAPDAGSTTKGTITPPSPGLPGGSTSTNTETTAKMTGGGCALGAGAPASSLGVVMGLLGVLGLLCLRRRGR